MKPQSEQEPPRERERECVLPVGKYDSAISPCVCLSGKEPHESCPPSSRLCRTAAGLQVVLLRRVAGDPEQRREYDRATACTHPGGGGWVGGGAVPSISLASVGFGENTALIAEHDL